MKRGLIIFLFVGSITAAVIWLFHPESGNFLQYSTSDNCQACHEENYRSWGKTLHPKMFRPVTSEADILGDFSTDNPVVTFSKSDIDYVIGNRWEQVYVTMIDGEYFPLPARWFVEQKEWSAYKVDSWHETPMSEKCNGCHTTGFDPETYEFSEFGIGCEACHGPGAVHVANRRKTASLYCRLCHSEPADPEPDIVRSVSSTVCGQCHSRGTSAAFSEAEFPVFNFPVQVIPGEDLSDAFVPSTPENDKAQKYWWGNGVAKARHQEFADWQKSNHAKALRRMKERYEGPESELTEACLECHSTDYQRSTTDAVPTLETAQYGITCVGCHDPHTLKSPDADESSQSLACNNCHRTDSACPSARPRCAPPCPPDKVGCADCHMPYVVKSGGWFSIRGHAFKVILPTDDVEPGMPNSCQNGSCHQDQAAQWVRQAYLQYYGEKSQ